MFGEGPKFTLLLLHLLVFPTVLSLSELFKAIKTKLLIELNLFLYYFNLISVPSYTSH